VHTLDTARAYCNRVIGMAAGKVVFDGPPEHLTTAALRDVYGAGANGSDVSEAITSTGMRTPRATKFETAGPLEPAFAGL
jgi:phosphonate transport system ATP-binding protein